MKMDGTVACWGSNDLVGQAEPPGGEFASGGAGSLHTCGAKTDRTVAGWGSDVSGESSPPDGEFASVSAGS